MGVQYSCSPSLSAHFLFVYCSTLLPQVQCYMYQAGMAAQVLAMAEKLFFTVGVGVLSIGHR